MKRKLKEMTKGVNWPQVFAVLGGLGLVLGLPAVLWATGQERASMLIIGGTLFLPIGFLLGILLIDPYRRAQLMRKLTKKNYGIVHLISRGKHITSFIRDFNDSFIWVGNAAWHITPNRIYNYEKKEQAYPIKPKDIFYNAGVPTLFLDLDTMKPLRFYEEEKTVIKPEEFGAALVGWVNNQIAKNTLVEKRRLNIALLILIAGIAIAAFFAYQNNEMLNQLVKIAKAGQPIIRNATMVINQ